MSKTEFKLFVVISCQFWHFNCHSFIIFPLFFNKVFEFSFISFDFLFCVEKYLQKYIHKYTAVYQIELCLKISHQVFVSTIYRLVFPALLYNLLFIYYEVFDHQHIFKVIKIFVLHLHHTCVHTSVNNNKNSFIHSEQLFTYQLFSFISNQ